MSHIQLLSLTPLPTYNLPLGTTLGALTKHLCQSLGFVGGTHLVLKYEDDEADWVSLSTDAEFQDALQPVKEGRQRFLKIQARDTKEMDKPLEFLYSCDSSSRTTTPPEVQDSKAPQETSSEATPELKCHNCQASINGLRYKCGVCADFDLCPHCESLPKVHPEDHPFLKIRHPLPATFQSVHVVTATLHQCRGHLSNVQPQLSAVAEQTKVNLASFSEEVAVSFQHLSEQFIRHANELKNELVNKFDDLKNVSVSDVMNEVRAFVPFSMYPKTDTSSTTTSPPVPLAPVTLDTSAPCPPAVSAASHSVVAPLPPPPQTAQNFASQLQILSEMGFVDTERNVALLRKHSGEINRVISELCN